MIYFGNNLLIFLLQEVHNIQNEADEGFNNFLHQHLMYVTRRTLLYFTFSFILIYSALHLCWLLH